jgi:hypothetical protein
MRINFRLRFGTFTFFGMLSKTQKLEGITSKVIGEKDKHYPFFDLENCSLSQAESTLKVIQDIYDMSNIYIESDFSRSFRALCFDKVSFKKYLKMLLTIDYLDYNFFYWTVQRGKATIRISQKENREKQKIVSVIRSFDIPIPKEFETVIYETGIHKRGTNILLGR